MVNDDIIQQPGYVFMVPLMNHSFPPSLTLYSRHALFKYVISAYSFLMAWHKLQTKQICKHDAASRGSFRHRVWSRGNRVGMIVTWSVWCGDGTQKYDRYVSLSLSVYYFRLHYWYFIPVRLFKALFCNTLRGCNITASRDTRVSVIKPLLTEQAILTKETVTWITKLKGKRAHARGDI